MIEALVVSNLVLWVAVVALGCVVFALTRQVGLLHERVAPVGALAVDRGPRVGDVVSEQRFDDLRGGAVRIGGAAPDGRRTLVFFVSPTCPVCDTLLPTLSRLVRSEGDVRVVYASDGPRDEHEAFRRRKQIDADPYVLSRELGLQFEVSKLPFAVLLDAQGVVRAKGMVNTREHLESLFQADELGVGSLQEYLGRDRAELTVVKG